MASKYFNDVNQAVEVFVETFRRAAAQPEVAATVADLNQLVYFDYTQDDPAASFHMDTRGGANIVEAGAPADRPDVTMINSLDTAHKSWSNKLNPVVAMATGQIKAKGSATGLLKLAPLLKHIGPIYEQVLEEKGLGAIKL